MDWVRRLPGLTEWARIVHHRLTMAEKLRNLALVPKKRMTAEDILDYGAEIVILATGAYWAGNGVSSVTPEPIPGAAPSQPHVLTPDQIMVEGKEPTGDSVLVYDAEGYFVGVSLAERYARAGKKVTYVTPRTAIGSYMQYTGEDQSMIPLLLGLGVECYRELAVTEIAPGRIEGKACAPNGLPVVWEADAVILATQRNPRCELYRELKACSEEWSEVGLRAVYRAGDCVSPRQQVADAIFDAHRLGREIDTSNPSVPLPWIREERFIDTTDADYDAMIRSDLPETVS